jgi:protein TonB
VKQIVFALILALGIHMILFGMEFDWLRNKLPSRPESRNLTMSLTYLTPQKAKPKNIVKKPDAPSKKNVLAKKTVKKRKPKPLPEPKPKEKVLKPSEIEKAPEKKPSSPEPEETEAVEEPDDLSPESTEDIMREEVSMVVDRGVEVQHVPVVREAMPLYRINPAPKYPRIARRRGYQGTVVLDVLVDRNGKVGDLRVYTTSGHSILDKAALTSVKDWAFEPGMRDDQKVEMWVRVPIRFQLN